VEFNQPLNANTFIDNGCVIKFPGEQKRGWKLSADEEYTGNLYIGAGVLDLNGFNLQLTGFNTIRRRYRFKRRMPDSKRRLQDSNGNSFK